MGNRLGTALLWFAIVAAVMGALFGCLGYVLQFIAAVGGDVR